MAHHNPRASPPENLPARIEPNSRIVRHGAGSQHVEAGNQHVALPGPIRPHPRCDVGHDARVTHDRRRIPTTSGEHVALILALSGCEGNLLASGLDRIPVLVELDLRGGDGHRGGQLTPERSWVGCHEMTREGQAYGGNSTTFDG